MKITVVLNEAGKVTGTARRVEQQGDGPFGGCLRWGPNHRVHEMELPSELESIRDARELPAALNRHLTKN